MSAKTRYLRQSPRKVRLVAGLIRGRGVSDALAQLSAVGKAARLPVEKTLRSALANAEHNFQKNRDQLFIKEIRVDEGPDMRRWRPRAFGRAAPILKHSCHILIQLGQREQAEGMAEQKQMTVAFEQSGEAQVQATRELPTQERPSDESEQSGTIASAGRYETAQRINVKDQKKSKGFMKKIFQRKTG